MRYRIVAAEPRPGYRLWLQFEDGTEGEVPIVHLVGKGVYAAWRDEGEFGRLDVDSEKETVVWPTGAYLSADTLHRELERTSPTSSIMG